MKILFATSNENKITEVKYIFKESKISPVFPGSDKIKKISVYETGNTYFQNAMLKAKAYVNLNDYPVIAEDSGLEIECLNGLPGLYSSRMFAGSQKVKIIKLLENIRQIKLSNYYAKYICSAVFLDKNKKICRKFSGELEGEIIFNPKGNHGFGYDPVFYVSKFGKTLAQLSIDQKCAVSHRGLAFRKILDFIEEIYH